MTNDSRPVQRPASNSTARKRDEEARAVSYSWPLSEAQVAALVERLEAQAREAEERFEQLLADRDGWKRTWAMERKKCRAAEAEVARLRETETLAGLLERALGLLADYAPEVAEDLAAEQAAALRATERVAPGRERLADAIEKSGALPSTGSDQADLHNARGIADVALALLAAQPTVAEVRARTLRELANDIDPTGYGWTDVQSAERFRQRLHDRADRIGGGA